MRIDSSGNVGIAKEDPEYKLDINSNHARIGNGTSVGIIQYGSNQCYKQFSLRSSKRGIPSLEWRHRFLALKFYAS